MKELDEYRQRLQDLNKVFEINQKLDRIKVLEEQSLDSNFWNDNVAAKKVLQESDKLKKITEEYYSCVAVADDIEALYTLGKEEGDNESMQEAISELDKFDKTLTAFEFKKMMNGDDDTCNALLDINSGAGGTEAQDWAMMLFRMYNRYLERNNFSFEVLDMIPGDEAGIKSATIEVKGDYAFGYLNAENGVHRLVRISPFDSASRRHTSFGSVYVLPVVEDNVDIDLSDSDIRVDTYRASGAGGQHVNKTDSAIRMTHLPTNIVAQCQSERSQIKNRETCIKILKARVYQHLKEEEAKKRDEKSAEKKKIEWGSQIRSYVLHPYNMVKDHRTDYETSNTGAVLDGDIHDFITAYLIKK